MLIVANQLIQRYGDEALLRAAVRHIELWNEGAYTGARVWNRIHNAILDIQRPDLIDRSHETETH